MIRLLLIPSSDYLGHPFPQRHNQIFERIHDGKDFEVHVFRFNIFGKARLSSRCIIHEMPLEFRTSRTPVYYLFNAVNHVKEILKIVKRESIDVVIAGNLLPPLLFEVIKKISQLKIPFIFDLQDYYPTSAAGYLYNVNSVPGTVVRGSFEGMTRALLRMADAVITPGVALAIYVRGVRGRTGLQQVHVVPNGISEHFLNQYNGRCIREKFGYREEDRVVGYVGSIEFWLDMKPLIEAISEACKQGVNIKFMLIGGRLQTAYVEKVARWIKQEGIEGITEWLGFIDHGEVPKYIAAMDIGTIPFDVKNPTAYYAAPNKLWEYLSQEVDVISTPIPEALAYKGLVNIARSKEDYEAILKKKAEKKKDKGDYSKSKVKVDVKKRTWNYSAEKIKEIICKEVPHKK